MLQKSQSTGLFFSPTWWLKVLSCGAHSSGMGDVT